MSTIDRVRTLVEPIVSGAGLDLYDLDLNGGVLRVVVDQAGGVGMEDITHVTREVSRALDDADPIPGRFTLEVSSPGLERVLRTPAHFVSALGTTVSVKTVPGSPGDRRLKGTLLSVDDDGITVAGATEDDEPRSVAFGDVERARTVFEWGPGPKPGAPRNPRTKRSRAAKPKPASTGSEKSRPQKKVTAP
jgi:ribosome maturation factor RimP